jgi:hypothetical protein
MESTGPEPFTLTEVSLRNLQSAVTDQANSESLRTNATLLYDMCLSHGLNHCQSGSDRKRSLRTNGRILRKPMKFRQHRSIPLD